MCMSVSDGVVFIVNSVVIADSKLMSNNIIVV